MGSLPLITIVDDDDSVRKSLRNLIRSVGYAVEVFASAEEFLDSGHLRETRCLILDVRMPGMSGHELHRRLAGDRYQIPVIFITAHGNGEARAQALGDGAVEYLLKPFGEEALLNAIKAALYGDDARQFRDGVKRSARGRDAAVADGTGVTR